MKRKLKRTLLACLLTMTLLLNLTACGSKDETAKRSDSVNQEEVFSDSALTLSEDEQAQTATGTESETETNTDEPVLADGKTSSNGWKEGILKVNGKIFNLSKTTLEQFTECDYTTDEKEMNYILYGDNKILLQDNTHQEIELAVKNYSSDKPLYQKNALICGYEINYAVENGLEGADVILPGNIKGGMTRDEIVSIMGTPDSDSTDTRLYYEYKENERTVYHLYLSLDDKAGTLRRVSYNNSLEHANVADDSNEIQSSLDISSETTKTDKSSPSASLKDAEIKIGSNVYTIPISVTDITELGYDTNDTVLNHVINPKETVTAYLNDFSDKGGNILYLNHFYNPSDNPRILSNCMACELSFNSEAENVSIAKGIRIGSTYDEVCKAFGKKEKEKETDSYTMVYTYSAKRGKVTVEFEFDSSNNKVEKITISVEELN